MIEVWRQCVTAVSSSPPGEGHHYMSVGALRAGGELREVSLYLTSDGTAPSQFFLAVSGTAVADAAAFQAATPLMQGTSAYRHLGKPGWVDGIYSYYANPVVFPYAMKVVSGSRWVHLAWLKATTRVICVVVTATVIGFAKRGANGLGVEDGLDR